MNDADRLYLELLFVGMILMTILYINNIFLYKRKLKDPISIMLLIAIIMGVADIMWSLSEFDLKMYMITYISSYCYFILFTALGAFISLYMVEQIGLRPRKIHIAIFYVIPFAVIVLGTLSSPWTHLMMWKAEDGLFQVGPLYDGFWFYLLPAYLFSPVFIALGYRVLAKDRRKESGNITVTLCVYGAIIPILYYMEVWWLGGEDTPYQTASLPVSIALVYLITNVSTRTMLDTQAHIEAVETDLRIATKIQVDALPPMAPEFADHLDLNLRASMNTAKEVGGDFFDYFSVDENRVCFLIADVSGKGTPAALFMMTSKTMIKDYALTHDSTAEIFNAVNARLCENNKEHMFATAWIGILDTRTMTLQYTNAGHNYPFLLRKGQSAEMIKKVHGLFLGGMSFTKYKQDEFQLEPGDRLLLYTDGVTEAHDRNNGLYGEDRLQNVLERTRETAGEDVLEAIIGDVNDYAAGVPQFDDITMVIVTVKD